MKAILKTNNLVTLSFAKSVLDSADIPAFVFDEHVSLMDGSIGAIPRRLMIVDEDETAAREVLATAGLGDDLCQTKQ